ncbi:glycosyltransferase family 2 protein [Saccharopolyspora sp. 5N708]|uniref:glycosyltransferase family 2 protein n=1 Tax=Saccharopolyspora sp. 5N708 TaxID=3457424 RepID=UPI003FD608C4
MSTVRTSVVVPTRDQAGRLAVTLAAFGAQDADPGSWELVVVDDGSVDATRAVLSAAAGDLPLRVRCTSGVGRAAARNVGASAAVGRLLVFCDGDRAPVPGFVRAHEQAHAGADSADVVVVGGIRERYLSDFDAQIDLLRAQFATGAGGPRARTPAFVRRVTAVYDADGRTGHPARWLTFLAGNVSLPARLFDRVGGFDDDFTEWGLEHFELGYRLARLGAEFRLCEAARNDHFAHRRPDGFYRDNLAASAARFQRRHPEVPADLLLELTLGGLTPDDFDRRLACAPE